MTVFENLEKTTKSETIYSSSDVYVKDIPEDIFFYLKDSIIELLGQKKMHQKTNNPLYETLGLTYNPNVNINGEEQYSKFISIGDDGRNDTHSFVRPLPHSSFLYDICEYTPLRAKVTRMYGQYVASEWHHDEPIDECIKVIIPIETNSQCLFQIDNKRPVNLEVGKAYFFNSMFFHRYIYGKCDSKVVHLVFGLSTKYQYDFSTGKWHYANRDIDNIDYLIDNSVVF